MENIAFEIIYGSYTQLQVLTSYLAFFAGAILVGSFISSEDRINRSAFFLYVGFLTFAASFTNLPWFLFWIAIERDFLWVIILTQLLLMITVGGLYILAAKQRALDALETLYMQF